MERDIKFVRHQALFDHSVLKAQGGYEVIDGQSSKLPLYENEKLRLKCFNTLNYFKAPVKSRANHI